MPELNNEGLCFALTHARPAPPRFTTVPPSPTLSRTLPTEAHLKRLSLTAAKQAQHDHIIKESIEIALDESVLGHGAPPPEATPRHGTESAGLKNVQKMMGAGKGGGHRYEPSDVLKAIEKKDIMTLMDMRGSQFDLLLKPIGGVTPLVHAMRRGKTHSEVQIVLLGAISKRTNDVTDDELAAALPETKALLRSIRANLRIGISHGLANNDPSLLASFLQVIIMSDGDKWILESSHKTALALRGGASSKPVESAGKLVEKWMGRELKAGEIAAVSEYVANATGDLVLLGLWSIVGDKLLNVEPIPLYYFARDDRISKALEERVEGLRKSGGQYHRLSKLLQQQIDRTLHTVKKRNIGGKERIAELAKLLDQ